MKQMIDKVAAIVIKDKKMLLVRKQSEDVFILPGGKREGQETDEECLRREMKEELNTDIEHIRFYNEYNAPPIANEKYVMKIRAYFCKTTSKLHIDSGIKEIVWVDSKTDTSRMGGIIINMLEQLKEEDLVN